VRILRIVATFILIILSVAGEGYLCSAIADIYTYTDEKGVVHK